jgi:hypothetical protein
MEIINSWEELMDETVEEPIYDTVQIGGKVVRIASLPTAQEVIQFIEAQNVEGADRVQNVLRLIARSIVDEAGNRIGKVEELERLRRKNTATIIKLKDAVMALNGLKQTAGAERKND